MKSSIYLNRHVFVMCTMDKMLPTGSFSFRPSAKMAKIGLALVLYWPVLIDRFGHYQQRTGLR